MAKNEIKIIALSVAAGLSAWMVNAFVDSRLFSQGSFWDSLILNLSLREIYFRGIFLSCFILLGIFISIMVAWQRTSREKLYNATAKMEDEKSRSEAIISAIGDGISIQDADFRVLYQNEVHKKLVGGDKTGERCYAAYVGGNGVCEGCPVARSFKDGEIHTLERMRKNGNATVYIEIKASPLKNPAGKIVAGIEVVRDITGRKNIEEELKQHRGHLSELVKQRSAELIETNERLLQEIVEHRRAEDEIKGYQKKIEAIINASNDIIYLKDTKFKFLVGNKALEKHFNVKMEDIIGKTDIDFMSPKAAEQCRKSDEDALNFEGPIDREEWVKDRCFHTIKKRVANEKGDLIGIAAIIRDITERKRLEEELLKAQKLESIGIFAGGIAHDFNNQLTGILGNISLAKLYLDQGHRAYKRLEKAEKASVRAQDLTQQLLTFSKGGAPIKKAASMKELIAESASFALRGSNVNYEFSIPEDIWPVEVDEGQITQVINNMLINAKQAMPEGGTIRLCCENVNVGELVVLPPNEGKYVKISIEDQGIGIPKEHLPKIFDPYFTTKQEGSGLGLTSSYSIIKKHDGYISAESEMGVGTTFYIYLPASEGKSTLKKQEDAMIFKGEGKILVMDDEDSIRDIAGEMMRSIGYQVEVAKNGSEAVALYTKAMESEKPFNLVIMDLTIPGGIGGKELMKKLLEIDPAVKAIVSSGYSGDPIMAEYNKYGFMDVVPKPYKMESLSEKIHRVLNKGDKRLH